MIDPRKLFLTKKVNDYASYPLLIELFKMHSLYILYIPVTGTFVKDTRNQLASSGGEILVKIGEKEYTL